MVKIEEEIVWSWLLFPLKLNLYYTLALLPEKYVISKKMNLEIFLKYLFEIFYC